MLENEIPQLISQMEAQARNNSYREIVVDSLPQLVFRPFKRLIRRMLFWYVQPIVVQQNYFNNLTVQTIQTLNEVLVQQQDKIMELADVNNEMRSQISNMKEETKVLRQRIEARVAEITTLKEASQSITKTVQNVANQLILLKKPYLYDEEIAVKNDDYRLSFSQVGEDMIINYIFSLVDTKPSEITYLDLGANHAHYLSNTYNFYREGASGVMVEANPILAKELERKRQRDIVINMCLAQKSGEKVKFYLINGDGLSTMDYEAAQSMMDQNNILSIDQIEEIETIAINDIVDKYFSQKSPEILNVDIEGIEMEILESINFNKFRPLIIICEMISYRTKLTIGEKNREIADFLIDKGYIEFAFTGVNSIFIDSQSELVAKFGFIET